MVCSYNTGQATTWVDGEWQLLDHHTKKSKMEVEKTKDQELQELRAESAKLKSGELSSLRELLAKEDAEAWKKQRRRGGGKGPDTYANAAASSSGP